MLMPSAGRPATTEAKIRDRHTVADPPLGDHLAHPHEQGDAGGDTQNRQQHEPDAVVLREQTGVEAVDLLRAAADEEHEPGALDEGQDHRQVAGPLGDLALPDRSLGLPLLQLRHGDGEDLDDDRRRDVGQDAETEQVQHTAVAGEQGQVAEDATLRVVDLQTEVLDTGEADAGSRDLNPEPVDDEDEDREQDLVPQLRRSEDVEKCGHRFVPCLTAGAEFLTASQELVAEPEGSGAETR